MIHAYLIEDVRALADLFKAGAAPKRSAHGQFTALRIRHPELAARRALLLCGVAQTALTAPLPPGVGRELRVSFEEGDLFLLEHGERQQLEIFDVQTAEHLEGLISPVPWRHEVEHDTTIVFWLEDASLVPELVRRSLYLNNDRIQLATLQHEDRQVHLVRVEAPSYYLLTWCEEQPGAKLTLYYPMTESPGLYVQWRHMHPLADLWRRAWSERNDQWAFFPAQGRHLITARPEWRSIYELATITLDQIERDGVWQQIDTDALRFKVPLRLAPRHEPAPVELLLLRGEERQRLENLLAMSDAKELDLLEFCAQRDARGEHCFFVREKHHGDADLLTQLGGQTFSRYKGFDNLFLPADQVLEPQLRRDQYKLLFELSPSSLCLVIPNTPPEQGARHVTLLKSSFEPLKHLVDHIVHFEREALLAILQDSLFDLDVYKDALSRPDLKRGEPRQPPARERAAAPNAASPRPRDTQEQRLQRKLEALRQRQQRRAERGEESGNPSVASSLPTELELLEAELERDLVRQGPTIELWCDLFDVKIRREQWQDAMICATEGLWSLIFPTLDAPAALDADAEAVAALRTGFTLAFERAQQLPHELGPTATLFAQLATPNAPPLGAAQIMDISATQRAVEARLSKKLRWLAGRELLIATRDVRAQEELREAILTDLNQRGLATQDSANFLRERILKDPELEHDTLGQEEADSGYLLKNIEVVERAIARLRTDKIRIASTATLARIQASMGLHARARDLIYIALQGMEQSLDGTLGTPASASGARQSDGRAWTSRVADFFRARPAAASGSGSSASSARAPERWHAWVALNAWIVFQRIEPARAEDAKKGYDLLLQQLQSYEREDMRRVAESLEARAGQTHIAEFLASDSRSFFSSRPLPDDMNKVVTGLRTAHRRTNTTPGASGNSVTDLVTRGVQLAERELTTSSHPSLETVARLILEMVEGLRRLKWDKEQRPVELFERFVKELPDRPLTPESSRLYFAVLHCAATRALMDLGREKEAMDRLTATLRWVSQDYMQVLDFVDLVKKEVLLAIELAPRNQRAEALHHLMSALLEQERFEIGDDPTHPGAGFEMPFQAAEIIQMIDHTLEAAISNEKLVLRRLRDFDEREEARIRSAVQRDQPATSSAT